MRHQFRTSVRARSSGLLGQKMQQVCNPAGRSRAQSYFGPLHVCAKTGAAVRVPVNSTHPDYDANAFRQTDRRFQASCRFITRSKFGGARRYLPLAICHLLGGAKWRSRLFHLGAVAAFCPPHSCHSCSLMFTHGTPFRPFSPLPPRLSAH